jgi:hypothetical protein
METAVRTPLEVFSMPQNLIVPLFQRPYVWDEEQQWEPLWQDIRRLAEHRLGQPMVPANHFLGAVVLQSLGLQVGSMAQWSIIDGQQRLTTLQLFFDAAAAVFSDRDLDQFTGQLEALTHNATAFVQGEGAALKLRHTNRDRFAYDEVMLADPPIAYEGLAHAGSLMTRAHQFFGTSVAGWLDEADGEVSQRATALTSVLTQSLQLVVIGLQADENSQEIFETLNARGTPLTAADLIKNFVFQRLDSEGVDTAKAYSELWPFESKFWEKEISVGRNLVTRGSLFLNQWLVSRLGEEIGPKATFTRFKHYVEHEAGKSMAALLTVIKVQAEQYQAWTITAAVPHADLDRVVLSVYRAQSADIEALKPVLLWLTEPGSPYTSSTVDGVVAHVESWFVRRMLLRLPLGDLGRVIADLITSNRGVSDDELVARVERFLRNQRAASTYWPDDDELRTALATEQAYRRYRRGRLRMFLEAAEDHLRGYTASISSKTGTRVQRVGLPIEHLLPRSWRDHWPVEDLAEEVERDTHVHRFGNLTLITSSLNSSISNGPWLGPKGKRAALDKHDVLLMNREIWQISEHGWTERLIDSRTDKIIDAFIATWPAPPGHVVTLDRGAAPVKEVSLRDLIVAGLIAVDSTLKARPGPWGPATCTVLPSGDLQLGDEIFTSPSGAGHAVRRGATNGWAFWEMPDGRRLKDVRAEYRAMTASTS